MKKVILLPMLILALASCKKEMIKDDFQLNREIDKKFSDNILTMSNEQLVELCKQKTAVLIRIKQSNPNITFKQLYPQMVSASRGDYCTDEYNENKDACTKQFLANYFVAVIVGVGGSVVATPIVGGGIGYTLVLTASINYRLCAETAIKVRDNCIKHQK